MTTRYGHYRRLFPLAAPFRPDSASLAALAERMFETGGTLEGVSSIPAGYTYLGQFINHDLSAEQLPAGEDPVEPEDVENLSSPRLDLGSLYGGGPRRMPFLYRSDGVRMRIGWSSPAHGEDLPRAGVVNEPQRALIGDSRNDENVIVSQLHLAFLKFHNAVADVIEDEGRLAGPDLFEAARQMVRWHYQWVVIHDFLPRLVSDPALIEKLLDGRVTPIFNPGVSPFIPVEFSAAAFRFGHSMVRRSYVVEPWFVFPFLRTDPTEDDLRGHRERPPGTRITDWKLFFGADPQLARKIDTVVVEALGRLPSEPGGPTLSMPVLDLLKGRRLGLPTGQAAAAALGLPQSERLAPEDFAELTAPGTPAELAQFTYKTPLWYYCLKEAEHFGQGSTLGPLAGRIVAEVLVGLLRDDPTSYLSKPDWRPQVRFGARVEDGSLRFGASELLAASASATR